MLDKLVNGQLIKCIDNNFVEYMLEVGQLYFFDSYAYGINLEPFRILIYTDKQPIVGSVTIILYYQTMMKLMPGMTIKKNFYKKKEEIVLN